MAKHHKKEAAEEESGEKAPLWIISFADMISLLMAFFVMLQAMAVTRSGELCNSGVGVFESTMSGFRKSINGFGVPGLFGHSNEAMDFNHDQAHWALESSDKENPNTKAVDGREEKIRRVFSELESKATTHKSFLFGRKPQFIVAPIMFGKNSYELEDDARGYLDRLANDLEQAGNLEKLKIYIVGIAPEAKEVKDQWIVSAKRGQMCANYLKDQLGDKAEIYNWGGGTGGEWTVSEGSAPKNTHVLIATVYQSN